MKHSIPSISFISLSPAGRKTVVAGFATLILSIAYLSSCSGRPIRLKPYRPSLTGTTKGAVYFLPRADVVLSFRVNIEAAVPEKCSTHNPALCRFIAGKSDLWLSDIRFETTSMPDLEAGFVIESNQSFMTESNFAGKFNQKGELVSGSGSLDHRGMELVATGLSALTRLLPLMEKTRPSATSLGADADRRASLIKSVQATSKLLDTLREKMTQTSTQSLLSQRAALLKAIVDSIKTAEKALESYQAELDQIDERLTKSIQVSIGCRVGINSCESDPQKPLIFIIDPSNCPAYQAVKETAEHTGIVSQDWPRISLSLEMYTPEHGAPTSVPPHANPEIKAAGNPVGKVVSCIEPGTEVLNGFVYRIPKWFEVTAKTQQAPLASSFLAIPQCGACAIADLDKNDLRPDKKLEVELHPGLGSLKKLHVSATPMQTEQLESLIDAFLPILDLSHSAQIRELGQETERLKAEIELLKARKELKSLKETG